MHPKYIMVDGLYPVLFATSISHDRMKHLGNITSAGFVKIKENDVVVYGESISLNLKAHPDDAELIKANLGM